MSNRNELTETNLEHSLPGETLASEGCVVKFHSTVESDIFGAEESLSDRELETSLDELELAVSEASDTQLGDEWTVCLPAVFPASTSTRIQECMALAKVQTVYADAAFPKVQAGIESVVELEISMQTLDANSEEYVSANEQFEARIKELETAAADFDKSIPLAWLHSRYLDKNLPMETTASYFGFFLRNIEQSLNSWERTISLSLASSTYTDREGCLQMRPVHEVASAWNGKLPYVEQDRDRIAVVQSFFRESEEALREFDSTLKAFYKDIYLDVVGYQVSLRDELFHPEILYACMKFHVSVRHWFHKKRREINYESVSHCYASVAQMFSAPAVDNDVPLGHRRAVAKKRVQTVDYLAVASSNTRKGNLLKKAVGIATAAVLVLILFPLASELLSAHSRDIKPMSAAMVSDIHPILQKAGKSNSGSLLIGTVSDGWSSLSEEERNVVAGDIRSAAAARQLYSVLIYDNKNIVVQVVEGKIGYVEKK